MYIVGRYFLGRFGFSSGFYIRHETEEFPCEFFSCDNDDLESVGAARFKAERQMRILNLEEESRKKTRKAPEDV